MKINIIEADELDYNAYSSFQKEAYRDLLLARGISDGFMSPEFYRWKYTTPFGKARIAQVVEGEKVVSSSAMVPCKIWDGEAQCKGWQCLDVATLPEVRKKGYFFATLKELVNSVVFGEIFYAFPNEKSIPSFLKLHCSENVLLTTWVNPLSLIVRRKCDEIIEISSFDSSYDFFTKKLTANGPMLDRSSAYLNWRYLQHPNNTYNLFAYMHNGVCSGLAVARKAHVLNRDIVLVMELLAVDGAASLRILRHLAAWTIDQKKVIMVMMNSSFASGLGVRVGFFSVPAFLLPKRQVLVVYAPDSLGQNLIKKNWNIQTGDWDVF